MTHDAKDLLHDFLVAIAAGVVVIVLAKKFL